MMEVARGEPIVCHDLRGQSCYRFIPAPVRPERHQHGVVSAVRGGWYRGAPPLVWSLVSPDGPADARMLGCFFRVPR